MTQEQFYALADEGKNIFLTGNAGTGKSFAINQLKNDNYDQVIITVAPTGIAAINAGGETIHSAFKLPFGYEYWGVTKQKINWTKIDVLIIDEVSMVGSWLLDQIDKTLKYKRYNNKPFGGIQVILVGDTKQLPPIITNEKIKQKFIKSQGGYEFYHSDAYKNGNFIEVNLTVNKRSGDQRLIKALNKIRKGKFNIYDFQVGGYSTYISNKSVHIMPYNKMVDSFNYNKLLKLKGKQYVNKAKIIGDFNVQNVLSPIELKLKEGCRVMITKNLPHHKLVNGDLGYVESIEDGFISFISDRTNNRYWLSLESWEEQRYDENGEGRVIGTFIQYPLRLAYAITIHKSQGLTLENVIYHHNPKVDIKAVYVALSRATSYDNLYINYER